MYLIMVFVDIICLPWRGQKYPTLLYHRILNRIVFSHYIIRYSYYSDEDSLCLGQSTEYDSLWFSVLYDIAEEQFTWPWSKFGKCQITFKPMLSLQHSRKDCCKTFGSSHRIEYPGNLHSNVQSTYRARHSTETVWMWNPVLLWSC